MTDEDRIREMMALWSEKDADKDADGFAAQLTAEEFFLFPLARFGGHVGLRNEPGHRKHQGRPPFQI